MSKIDDLYKQFFEYDNWLKDLGLTVREGNNYTGPGWRPLIESTFKKLQDAGWAGEVLQVKEKFGGLRLYINGVDSSAADIIYDAQDESLRVCEECGAEGGGCNYGGRMMTRCKPCLDKFIDERALLT